MTRRLVLAALIGAATGLPLSLVLLGAGRWGSWAVALFLPLLLAVIAVVHVERIENARGEHDKLRSERRQLRSDKHHLSAKNAELHRQLAEARSGGDVWPEPDEVLTLDEDNQPMWRPSTPTRHPSPLPVPADGHDRKLLALVPHPARATRLVEQGAALGWWVHAVRSAASFNEASRERWAVVCVSAGSAEAMELATADRRLSPRIPRILLGPESVGSGMHSFARHRHAHPASAEELRDLLIAVGAEASGPSQTPDAPSNLVQPRS